MRAAPNEDASFTDDTFCSKLLSNSNIQPAASYLENFLGENTDSFHCDFLIACKTISEHQQNDYILQHDLHSNAACAIAQDANRRHPMILRNDKMRMPSNLSRRMLSWCHEHLKHPGSDRLRAMRPAGLIQHL